MTLGDVKYRPRTVLMDRTIGGGKWKLVATVSPMTSRVNRLCVCLSRGDPGSSSVPCRPAK